MKRSDFHYELPESLIASRPSAERTGSRLLCLDGPSGGLENRAFPDLLDQLEEGDLMIFNDTRVIPARLFGQKESGGKLELLVERVLDSHRVLAHLRASKSPKVGSKIKLGDELLEAEVIARHEALFELRFHCKESVVSVLERIGHMPLPPYIEREDEGSDRERYQTVFGQKQGAVAAPTAGLHFDEAMLERIRKRGVEIAFVTLHVGSGTFQPVRADDIREHNMHSEIMELSEEVAQRVRIAKAEGRRVIAVGTTSVRCLETAASFSGDELISAFQGETNIFIYPSYEYKVVDALVTNFHLPESTLLMLVSAFAGYQHTMAAYRYAVEESYRFFSYGDAMFITRNPAAEKHLGESE